MSKSKVACITISVDELLLQRFEEKIAGAGYPSRSEAMKELLRKALVEQEWQEGKEVAGTISLVYDHHEGSMVKKVVSAQHDFGKIIICSQHVHLDHFNCLEVLVVRGTPLEIRELLVRLKAVKGMKHTALMMTTTGEHVH
jgi:CopG family nickel-responsive transcriptional regulator